jgi:uncharacterized protein (DUF1684 family)/VanZ family protein
MRKNNWSFNHFAIPISLSLLIIVISLIPLPKLPEMEFIATDKLGHLLAFFVLQISYLWAFSKSKFNYSFAKNVGISFALGTLIGGGVELLQHYLPVNRFGDWFDFYFDIAGLLIATVFYKMVFKKKVIILIITLLAPLAVLSQSKQTAREFQEELNREFGDLKDSPLDSLDRLNFEALDFFPIDNKFQVEAKLVRANAPAFFEFETSTSRRPEYRVWAIAYFSIDDLEYELTIYQSKKLMNTLEYGDYLFLPFSDLTNGESTYYGGRYVDLRIVEGDSIIIDFNKSYNPYCAYSDRYSCPLVPDNNKLDLYVTAGVKKFH